MYFIRNISGANYSVIYSPSCIVRIVFFQIADLTSNLICPPELIVWHARCEEMSYLIRHLACIFLLSHVFGSRISGVGLSPRFQRLSTVPSCVRTDGRIPTEELDIFFRTSN